jgi:hypothetical protein
MPHNPRKEKARAPQQQANSKNKQLNNTHNSAASQRQILLAALRKAPMSTLEIRRKLDILGVAPRILELRRAGYKILTHWRDEPTDCGKLHTVAFYVLVREAVI